MKQLVDPLMERIKELTVNPEAQQLLKILANTNMEIRVVKGMFFTEKGIAQAGVISPGLWNLHILPLAKLLHFFHAQESKGMTA